MTRWSESTILLTCKQDRLIGVCLGDRNGAWTSSSLELSQDQSSVEAVYVVPIGRRSGADLISQSVVTQVTPSESICSSYSRQESCWMLTLTLAEVFVTIWLVFECVLVVPLGTVIVLGRLASEVELCVFWPPCVWQITIRLVGL